MQDPLADAGLIRKLWLTEADPYRDHVDGSDHEEHAEERRGQRSRRPRRRLCRLCVRTRGQPDLRHGRHRQHELEERAVRVAYEHALVRPDDLGDGLDLLIPRPGLPIPRSASALSRSAPGAGRVS